MVLRVGTLALGTRIAHYEIQEQLGAGGMGVVYRAFDIRLKRNVAIKLLSGEDIHDPDRRARFLREAQSASTLSHPNILTVFETGSEGEHDYIATELIEGESLYTRLKRGRLPREEAYRIAYEVADAISTAHKAGIIHRDLKPGNIMIRAADDRTKLLDFGLARSLESTPRDPASADLTATAPLTVPGQVLGTPSYMSPEQAMGWRADARSDIFAFGCILYEMLTGERPFRGESNTEVLVEVVANRPPKLDELKKDLPPDIAKLIESCLQKKPEARPQSMVEVMNDLRPHYLQATFSTAGLTLAPPVRKPSRRWIYVSLATLLLTLGIAWFTYDYWVDTDAPSNVEAVPQISPEMGARQLVRLGYRALDRMYLKDAQKVALEAFQLASSKEPTIIAAYAGIAEAVYWLDNGKYDAHWINLARNAAKDSRKRGDRIAASQLTLGLAALVEGKAADAEARLRQAHSLDPQDDRVLLYLGRALLEQRKLPEAEQVARKAIQLQPKRWLQHSLLAQINYRNARYEVAAAEWKKSTELAPSNTTTYRTLAAALHMLERTEEAKSALQRGLAIAPDPLLHANLGTLHFYQAEFVEAASEFDNALKQGATSYRAWGNLADAQRWAPGQREKSRLTYQRAIQVAQAMLQKRPDSLQTRVLVAGYKAKSNDLNGARADLNALRNHPKLEPADYYALGVAAELVGDRPLSLELLGRALQAGYSSKEMEHDPELIEVRQSKEFQSLLLTHKELP